MHASSRDLQALLDSYTSSGKERGFNWRSTRTVNSPSICARNFQCRDWRKSHRRDAFPGLLGFQGRCGHDHHRLVARGLLAYDETIATCVAEFGCLGKEGITLGDVLSHSAGMQNIPAGTRWEDLGDWAGMCGKLAGSSPAFPPARRWSIMPSPTDGWLENLPAE